MAFSDTLTFGIEAVMGIFIFFILFTALLPTIIGYIQNNSTTLGLPEATILIVSLLGLVFVLGVFMMLWKKLTQPERPQVYG